MVWIGLEGCDGTGKSTLAAAVVAELEARFGAATLIHRGPPERSVLEEYATDIEGREDEHLVFDRWHLGTLVYAPLYRSTGPYGELGLAGFRWVEKFLQARGTTFWTVNQPYDIVKQRLETRGEDYLQSHHVQHVLQSFAEVNDKSVLTRRPITPSNDIADVPALAASLVDKSLNVARDAEPLREFPSYVGPRWPSILLVGEKRGGKPPFASQACFMPLKNKSGEYLWEWLTEDVSWQAGAANAYEDNVPELWKVLEQPAVVALGAAASKSLVEAGVPHATVPHPQKVKRFHNKMGKEYGELIAEIAGTTETELTWPS